VVMFWDPYLTMVMVVSVVAASFVMVYSENRMKVLSAVYQEREREVSGRVADLIRGTRHVKLYAIEEDVSGLFRTEAESLGQHLVRRDVRTHELIMGYEVINYIGFALLLLVGAWRFVSGHVQIGELAAYLSAFIALGWPMSVLFQIAQARGGAHASVERMAAVMDTLSTTPEPAEPARLTPPPKAPIRFDNVNFHYTDVPVIENFNLTIPYGQSVALVGASGSGKSTLSQLMLRLYDPESGVVSIGGVNLKNCSGRDVRRMFGIVPQQPYFFCASVLDNVRLLKPSATEDEVWRVLELAHATTFVRELPEGLATLIGEEGSTLSGGQRQRLAIARALLASPSYFIFDEATSALDTVSEKNIQETLRQILPGHTAIIIAHRLATMRHCERILVLNAGQIVQDGTYDELISQEGPFAEMARQHEVTEVA